MAAVADAVSPGKAPDPDLTRLVGMEDVQEIISSVVHTGFIVGPGTCSVILVSPSGSGKSQNMLAFRNYNSVRIHGDLTTMRMADILAQDRKNIIKHFLLPDLNTTLSHKGNVVQLFLSSLMTLQSEGVFDTGEGTKCATVSHAPVGIITGCTPEMFKEHHRKMRNLGLIRRNAPIFFTLSDETIARAQREKSEGKIHGWQPADDPNLQVTDINIPDDIAKSFIMLSKLFAQNLSLGPVWGIDDRGMKKASVGIVEVMLPLGPHDYLRKLAKGHALMKRHDKVDSSDVDFVEKFVEMTNYGKDRQL